MEDGEVRSQAYVNYSTTFSVSFAVVDASESGPFLYHFSRQSRLGWILKALILGRKRTFIRVVQYAMQMTTLTDLKHSKCRCHLRYFLERIVSYCETVL